tara:strand:+ start:8553 stop:11024 length:2472 start_codon:yes stop_codon:yes gene_type:complete
MSSRRVARDPLAVAEVITVAAPPLGATPVPVELAEYPEPVPRHEGTTRFLQVSTSEYNVLQARRRRERARAAQGATLVTLQFLAEQLGSTTHAVALFTGLAARVVWLRRARRRRGPLVAALVAFASRSQMLPEEARAVAGALVSPAPLSRLAGWSLLAAGAVAPHRAFVKMGSKVVVRLARIPKIRRLLRRKWPIWGKLLMRNKLRAEVTSYQLAINEAWEALEGTLPSDQLSEIRAAESSVYTRSRSRERHGEINELRDDSMFDDDDVRSTETQSNFGDDDDESYCLSTPRRDKGKSPIRRLNSGGCDSERRRFRTGASTSEASNVHQTNSNHKGFGPIGLAARFSGTVAARVGHVSRSVAHATLVWTPSSVFGVLTGREFGAELLCPPTESLQQLTKVLAKSSSGESAETMPHFTEAQRCAFLLQYSGDPRKAARACSKSQRWRANELHNQNFLNKQQLKAFEDVVFVHGKRSAYTGGVHLVLRLSEVHRISTEFGYDAVVAAIISHVEMQWVKLGIAGKSNENPGKLRGRLVALVDCRGVTPGTFPASLVATTLITLDSNYPELAAEVHVVNVWWLVKRFLTWLLEATSKSTRRRVRIYRGDDTGFEKLGIRFASHALPACFPGGRCACRQCRRLAKRDVKFGALNTNSIEGRPEFQHGGLLGRYYRWEQMSTSQKRQYIRHLFFYYVGLFTFWPVHIFRLNAHPFLVGIIRFRKLMYSYLRRLRAGDPLCVFIASVVTITSLAFTIASIAWWAEYGATLLIQSARNPPKTWDEAWVMHGLFTRSIGASLEGSLGLEKGTLQGQGSRSRWEEQMEDGGWV